MRHDSSSSAPLGSLLRQVSRLANGVFRQEAKARGLTTRQAAAIVAVVAEPGITVGRLAGRLDADQATTSILADRLVSAGLLRREADQVDRRRMHLYPEERAIALAQQLGPALERAERQIRDALGEEDAERLRALLLKLRAALEELPAPSTSTDS